MDARGLMALGLALACVPAAEGAIGAGIAPAEPALVPFSARYGAEWKSINVGTSDLELKPDAAPGTYFYTWTMTARGVFRLAYSNDVIQKSWFSVVAEHVRPVKYHAEEGAASVDIDFEWDAKHARGVAENKPVDLEIGEGTQDLLSIQIEVMLDLKNGNLPKTFRILDKDQVKDFVYTEEGPARIRTALGGLDTVVVSSRRIGNNRVLRMWFAPSLGFVPVQAERFRDGKLEFAMRIKSLQR